MTHKNDMKLERSVHESRVGGTLQAHPSAAPGLPSRSQAAGSRGAGQSDGPGPVPEMGGGTCSVWLVCTALTSVLTPHGGAAPACPAPLGAAMGPRCAKAEWHRTHWHRQGHGGPVPPMLHVGS